MPEPLDYAAIQAEHAPQPSMQDGWVWCRKCTVHTDSPGGPCLPYRLAMDAERFAKKVAQVEAQRDDWRMRSVDLWVGRPSITAPKNCRQHYRDVLKIAADRLDAALADRSEQVP